MQLRVNHDFFLLQVIFKSRVRFPDHFGFDLSWITITTKGVLFLPSWTGSGTPFVRSILLEKNISNGSFVSGLQPMLER